MKDVQQGHGRAVLRLQVLNATGGSLEAMESLQDGHMGPHGLKLKAAGDSSDEDEHTAPGGWCGCKNLPYIAIMLA